MADIDVSQTQAGKFARNVISRRDQLIIQCVAIEAVSLSSSTKPTTAQWTTALTAALKLQPPTTGKIADIEALRAAMYWQAAVNGVGSGIAVANQSTSTILGNGSYLQGLSETELEMLSLYLLGKASLTVFT